jgi:hypothetical protein
MIKGHLHQQGSYPRSTKPAHASPSSDTTEDHYISIEDYAPAPTTPAAKRTHTVFVDVEPINGMSYSDQAGRFLAPSATGNEYACI